MEYDRQPTPDINVRSYSSIWLLNSQLINLQWVLCLFYEYLQQTVLALTWVIIYIYY